MPAISPENSVYKKEEAFASSRLLFAVAFCVHFALNDFVNRTAVDFAKPTEFGSAFRTTPVTVGLVFRDAAYEAFDQRPRTLFVVAIQEDRTLGAIDLYFKHPFCFHDLFSDEPGCYGVKLRRTNPETCVAADTAVV